MSTNYISWKITVFLPKLELEEWHSFTFLHTSFTLVVIDDSWVRSVLPYHMSWSPWKTPYTHERMRMQKAVIA